MILNALRTLLNLGPDRAPRSWMLLRPSPE
jgi:hypothetical protein